MVKHISQIIKEHYQKIGQKGGQATAAKHDSDYYRAMQKKGAEVRRKKKLSP